VQRPVSSIKETLSNDLETFLHNHYTEHVQDLHEASAGFVTMQAITPLEISSTSIRNTLKNRHSARYLMADSVLEYIRVHQLY
jgi:nicotinate-nucleotide adenylyltransferase